MTKIEQTIQDQINYLDKEDTIPFHSKNIGDNYHTIGELYDFRKVYNAALFNEWGNDWIGALQEGLDTGNVIIEPKVKYNVHKSTRHHDGELCFGGGWFIVVAMLPDGQISNHYKMEDWGLFNIPETEKALFPFDGHTGKDVLERLTNILGE